LQESTPKGTIRLSPLEAQPEGANLLRLKTEIMGRWPMTSLLDMLKEVDLRIHFTQHFKSARAREALDRRTLQRRLLLCLYALGTNTGLKRICTGQSGEDYRDLLYVRRHYLSKDQLRSAITDVVNALFRTRRTDIWGEGTTACASDSKKFSAWDQNLLTEWHIRYRGPGIMVYWHVDRKAACIYSQVKSCSSSEVASMIEGVLRHCTEMEIDRQYVDSHGQSIMWTLAKPKIQCHPQTRICRQRGRCLCTSVVSLLGSPTQARLSCSTIRISLSPSFPPFCITFRHAAIHPIPCWPMPTILLTSCAFWPTKISPTTTFGRPMPWRSWNTCKRYCQLNPSTRMSVG